MIHINKNLTIAVFVTLSMAFYSCNADILNEYPYTEIALEEAITDVDGANSALYGVYDVLQSFHSYGCDMIIYGDVRGEDMQPVDGSGSRSLGFYQFNNRNSDNVRETLWSAPYIGLNRVNNLISAFNNEQVQGISEDDKNNILGQALVLRALFHFDVCRLFGAPYMKDKTQPGAIKADRVIGYSEEPNRESVEVIYNFIVEDLKQAVILLEKSQSITNGFINYWAAEALLARVYMYMGNWAESFTLSSDVIENGPYELLANEAYIAGFAADFNSESVFDVANTTADNVHDFVTGTPREGIGSVAHPDGYAEIIVTDAFVQLLNQEPTDVRIGFLQPDKTGALGYFAKYPGRDGDYMVNNIHVIRLSEIYLNAAEAALKQPTTDQASADKYLNAIRGRAIDGATDITATVDNVLIERRKELVGEGHRFYDIMRLGLTVTRTGGRHFLNAGEAETVGWQEPLCVLPVPRAELNVNPDVGQTEGYGL